MNRSEAFDKTGDVPQQAAAQQAQFVNSSQNAAFNYSYEYTQQLRRAALAKLTTEEIDALGVRNLRWYDDLNHGSGQSAQK